MSVPTSGSDWVDASRVEEGETSRAILHNSKHRWYHFAGLGRCDQGKSPTKRFLGEDYLTYKRVPPKDTMVHTEMYESLDLAQPCTA